MKTVKLIALDLDGTLVREDMTISKEDRDAVRRAQEAGVHVVIATGRIYQTAKAIAEGLHISTPVVCCNGADVRMDGSSIWSRTIPEACLRDAYAAMEPYCIARFVFCGDHIYSEQGTQHEDLFSKWGYDLVKNGLLVYCSNAESLMQTVGDGTVKFLACTDSEKRHPEMLQKLLAFGCFDVVRGERLHFEMTRKGINKAEGLAFVAAKLGVDMQDTLAIGDSINDLAMIGRAGIGVAMGNSMPELLEAADDVTLPIGQNGVARAIYKHLHLEQKTEGIA